MEETDIKYLLPNKENLKSQKAYSINSDKNTPFNINVRNYSSYIEIQAQYKDNMKKNEFRGKFSLEKLKLNKFLSIYDSIDEIYDELIHEFSKNNPQLIEKENNININIPIGLSKFKEIVLILNVQSKTNNEICRDLYDIVCDLKKQIDKIEIDKNEKNEKINLLNKETEELKKLINNYSLQINNCNQKIENLYNDNKILKEKMNILENVLTHFKNENLKPNDKFQSSQNSIDILNDKMDILKPNFINIDNPWTDEKDKDSKEFNYILKDGNYYAERNNSSFIYSIKSKHKFEKNKIYQLIYYISYKEGKFRVGFGDFKRNNSRLKEKGSIGFTNEGLYIDGVKISDIKIEKKNKIIKFIINLKKTKYFELFADGIFLGKFEFYLENIFGVAAIDKGNSVTIKTLQSS